mmetsp:Transcript_12629/g.27549  ORF Transcript_12629/g.27549 Transcript_12629/m.27549 type:complete len:84 (-) Transcript_12629:281-532(-)
MSQVCFVTIAARLDDAPSSACNHSANSAQVLRRTLSARMREFEEGCDGILRQKYDWESAFREELLICKHASEPLTPQKAAGRI